MRRLSLIFAALAGAGAIATSQSAMQQLVPLARGFDGEVGVFAVDLISGEEVSYNADIRFPTASTIKTAVMVEAYHQAAEQKLSLDDALVLTDAHKVGGSGVLNGMSPGTSLKLRDLVHLMIVLSDNTLFTRRGADTNGGPDNAGVLAGARISRAIFDHVSATRR